MHRCLNFSEAYAHFFSQLYQKIGNILLPMKRVSLVDFEHTAKPFNHSMLTKERHSLKNGIVLFLFRAGQNLKHLHNARPSRVRYEL